MSGREVRIIGDQRERWAPADRTISEDAWHLQRRAIEAHARGRDTAARASVVAPESPAAITPPALVLDPEVLLDLPRGSRREVIGPVNVYQRLESLERLAHADGVRIAAVWALVHESGGVRLNGAVASDDQGRAHVFIVTRRAQCPLLRLSTFRHETRHVERLERDLTTTPQTEAEYFASERDCNEAAAAYVREFVEIANERATCRIDADACVACATGSRQPCRQGAAVYEQVTTILGIF